MRRLSDRRFRVDEACEEHDVDADVFLTKMLATAKAAA